jgi:hypothetical protein
MKSRYFLLGRQCAFSALFLLVLNLLITGTAFGATTPPGGLLAAERASWRRRPIDVSNENFAREPGSRRLAHLTVASTQPILAATPVAADPSTSQTDFERFVDSVRNGQAGVVRGVYVPGVLALRVVQQSAGNPNYVSLARGTATQYGPAGAYGVTGLLADDSSSGASYYALSGGQEVRLVFGDGNVQTYHVSALYRYRALSPNDVYSNFEDLNSGEVVPAIDLFGRMYSGGNHITFQTCIAQDGLLSWGRLFVIATPA